MRDTHEEHDTGYSLQFLQEFLLEREALGHHTNTRASPQFQHNDRAFGFVQARPDGSATELTLTYEPRANHRDARIIINLEHGRLGADGVFRAETPGGVFYLPAILWNYLRLFTPTLNDRWEVIPTPPGIDGALRVMNDIDAYYVPFEDDAPRENRASLRKNATRIM